MKTIRQILIWVVLFFSIVAAQTMFDVGAYKHFLQSHQNMSAAQLLQMHDAGAFYGKLYTSPADPLFLNQIDNNYQLTPYEKDMLRTNGFVVSQRLAKATFGDAVQEVFSKDLPIYLSADAVLHAWHMSYDRILRTVEESYIAALLEDFLQRVHGRMSALNGTYGTDVRMAPMLKDVDVYVTVARRLLTGSASPYYADNSAVVENLINMIAAENIAPVEIMSSTCRAIDFSQFKPRSHYNDTEQLRRYFRTMMWLGRTEIYLSKPRGIDPFCPAQSDEDIRRQTIDAFLLREAVNTSGAAEVYTQIEDIIKFFVGEQDNVTIENLNYLAGAVSLLSPAELLNNERLHALQDTLKKQPFAAQKILTQLIAHDIMEPDSVIPATAFLPFGQRFVIDSYITGSVVYDKIKYNGTYVKRMLPSTLDVLFALGNNAAAQLLRPELEQYHYATNLASLRYLVNSYDSQFWNASLFNMWLNALRSLNPPDDRSTLPPFMRTAAFWQKSINTQLFSWTQLRHDNLLYAKQSYSMIAICFFPFTYIEPFPDLYLKLKTMAANSSEKINGFNIPERWKYTIKSYFDYFSLTMDTLYSVAQKELSGAELDAQEVIFLAHLLSNSSGCVPDYDGWYTKLFFCDASGLDGRNKKDFIVADIHTSPSDENGAMVGWVKHCGTGPVNLGVFIAPAYGNQNIAFIGPVGSYYEYTSQNFFRISDQEWAAQYLASAARPPFVRLYLTDSLGNSMGAGQNLTVGVNEKHNGNQPEGFLTAANYPNPFNAGTIISFTVPASLGGGVIDLSIYDVNGRLVKRLINEDLPPGNYVARWDGDNEPGQKVSSGIYIYTVKAAGRQVSGKMTVLK